MKAQKKVSILKSFFIKNHKNKPKIKPGLFIKKVMTFLTIIYFLLWPTNSLIKKKLVERMSNLSPTQQKEIENYLLPIPSRYEKHKNRELVKVINYLQLKNYSEITNSTEK